MEVNDDVLKFLEVTETLQDLFLIDSIDSLPIDLFLVVVDPAVYARFVVFFAIGWCNYPMVGVDGCWRVCPWVRLHCHVGCPRRIVTGGTDRRGRRCSWSQFRSASGQPPGHMHKFEIVPVDSWLRSPAGCWRDSVISSVSVLRFARGVDGGDV